VVDRKQVLLHWPKGKPLSLVGRACTNGLRLHIRKDRDMFAASGTLTVNPELSLDLLQLIDLLESSPSRYVELEKGRFVALTDTLRQYIETLSLYGNRHATKDSLQFPKSRAMMLDTEGADVKVRTDKHWKEWKAQIRAADELQIPVPSTLQAELRDYQKDGFVWMARLAALGAGALLADDMGLGKTIQALALLLRRGTAGPSLVVAPTSVAGNWKSEIERFAPTLNVRMFGDGDRATQLKSAATHDVFVCSYGLLQTESKRLGGIHWATVILDEAQYIKNEATKRSSAAKGVKADFRLIMTGTPVENNLSELWNLIDFINPGLLGSAESFQERFVTPIEADNCKWTRQRLKRLIQPYLLRRTKAQVLDELPGRTEIVRKVVLTAEEAALYEALRQKAMEKLNSSNEGSPGHIQILAELMRLRRACCHPRLIIDDWKMPGAKLTLFLETIDDLVANHHKVLVFSQFVDHLAILRAEIEERGIPYQYLDGSTPAPRRKECIDAFQAGDGDVFFISLKAGGLGLNLTAADYVIHMDPWWNPAVEDQASDRAHRMGQKRPVTIYRFITQGTVEEKIQALHKEKRALADSLLEGADISGKLSARELLDLIRV
jgi:SNF2 family DNA or RNA helicase